MLLVKVMAFAVGAGILFGTLGAFAGEPAHGLQKLAGFSASIAGERPVYYRYCRDAQAAGVTSIYRGQPGYRPILDRDSDGIACEPYDGA